MTDAVLSFDIDSAPAAEAAGDLDRMTAAAKRAEDQATKTSRATEAYAKAVEAALRPVTALLTSIDRSVAQLVNMGQAQTALATSSRDLAAEVQKVTGSNTLAATASTELAQASRAAASVLDQQASAAAKVITTTAGLATGADRAASSLHDMADAIRQQEAAERAAFQATSALTESVQDLGQAASQADAHMQAFKTATTGAASNLGSFDGHIIAHRKHLESVRAGYRLTASEGLNMSRQVTDVGVQMAMGMSPFLIAVQQGPQIFDIFQQAAIRTGTTVRTAMVATGAAVWAALAPLLPLIAGIAATAAVIGGAFALGTRAASKEVGDLTKGLNLSEKQLERLKEKGTSTAVTMGDVFRGAGTTIKEAMTEAFGPQLDWLSKKWGEFLDAAWQAVISVAKGILTAFIGTYYAIRDTWKLLPAAIGDAAVTAANAAIRAVESLINGAAKGINTALSLIDKLRVGMGQTALNLRLSDVDLAEINNSWAGAMEELSDTVVSAYERAGAQADEVIDRTARNLTDNIRASGQARVLEDAGKDKSSRSSDRRAESLQRELEAMRATTRGNFELAQAYLVSAEAAMRAQAAVEARGKAIRRQGEQEAFIRAQLALNASEIARDAAKTLADLQAENEVRARLLPQLEAGTLSADQLNEALAEEAALRPLLAAALVTEGEYRERINRLIEETRVARAKNVEQLRREQEAVVALQTSNDLELLRAERTLINATNAERAVSIAQLAEQQRLRSMPGVTEGGDYWQARMTAVADLATKQIELNEAQTAYNLSLEYSLDLAQQLHDHASSAAQGLADSFGRVGESIGGIVSQLTGFNARMEGIADAQRRYVEQVGKANIDAERMAGFDRERAQAQIEHYGDLAGAAKSAFAEQTAAYKLLHAAEQTFRVFQFAMAVKAMALKATEHGVGIAGATTEAAAVMGAETAKTAATVAGTSVRTPLKAAEGAASMFAALGPFGFPAVAAMFAVLAAIGFSGGGGGAGSVTLPPTNNGSGTTLGDPSAPSESLSRSMDMVERYQREDLMVSRSMLDALRSIETDIGAVVASIARQLDINTAAVQPNLGTSTSRQLFGLMSTTRSTSLAGHAIDLQGGALADLIARGVSGSIITILEHSKTKSGFLGIGGGTTTWQTETRSPIDAAMSRELGQILASLRAGVLTAAQTLGIEGATATLDSMVIALGRIDFTGLSSAEISQRLTQVFSAVGDQMALALLPELQQFQQAGEGLMETLTRLATQVQTVDARLNAIGMSLNATGIAGIAARDRLVQLSGGLDQFLEATSFFAETFLTDAQRLAPIQALVTAELTRLGLSADLTREQFASTVLGLDLTTEAGAAMFAALMQLAPAFDQVVSAAEDSAARLAEEARRQAEAAARIADQRRGLEIALLDATGQTTAALEMRRAAELEAMDESLRDLQRQVWAAQDAAAAQAALARAQEEAARAAEQYRQQLMQNVEEARGRLSQAYQREASELEGVISRFDGFATSLRAFRDSLGEQAGGGGYEAARAAFNRTLGLARQGDETALGGLQGAAQTYLEAARSNATSQEAYLFELARVRRGLTGAIDAAEGQKSVAEQQLDRLKDQVRGLIDLNENVLSVRDAITALHDAMRRAGVTAFATGGTFSNGLVTTPTVAPMALFGEAGPEAIMPLARGPRGLGVRAVNDNDDQEELKALREEIALLRAETRPFLQAIAANTGRSERSLDRMETFGLNVRGQAPGDPVEVVVVEDAA